jgi:hypothetical protein
MIFTQITHFTRNLAQRTNQIQQTRQDNHVTCSTCSPRTCSSSRSTSCLNSTSETTWQMDKETCRHPHALKGAFL